ncbi:MAG: hypothetical protein ACRDTR_03175, partial [Rubrobacter sp.]
MTGLDMVAVITLVISILALIATVIYGEIGRRQQVGQQALAEEQLRLAREQAEMRPRLSVDASEGEQILTLREVPVKKRPRSEERGPG